MSPLVRNSVLRLAIPKGRMQQSVVDLLAHAGVGLSAGPREYRPQVSLPDVDCKLLKPQNVVGMLAAGARDVGFAGADWVGETGAELVELLDTGLDKVRIVAAAPESILEDGRLPRRPLVIASEYRRLTETWIRRSGLVATLLQSYGATEVFPPEDADCIVDNTSTGATLAANGLRIIDELLVSSTRLYASPAAMRDPSKRERIETLSMLCRSVLEARRRVMIDLNVAADRLEQVVAVLPCMREPTVSTLHAGAGFAVRAAVPRAGLAEIIPKIRSAGGTDIVVSNPGQIIP